MAVLVKICGLNSAEAADAAVRAGADFAGLVFHPKSPRHMSLEAGRALAERLRGHLKLTVLLVDPVDEEIAAVLKTVKPDLLQLHGREPPERVRDIRILAKLPLIKAIHVADADDLIQSVVYEPFCDMFLFDAKAPGSEASGGRGIAFDWQLLRGRSFGRPWLLAGGLTPVNVARAITSSGAPGVDVSSGVEMAPGVKSAALIAEFVSAARNLQEARS